MEVPTTVKIISKHFFYFFFVEMLYHNYVYECVPSSAVVYDYSSLSTFIDYNDKTNKENLEFMFSILFYIYIMLSWMSLQWKKYYDKTINAHKYQQQQK